MDKLSSSEISLLEKKAKDLRWEILNMIRNAKASHIGSSFSIVEILLVLYKKIMSYDPKDPWKEDRDRFLLSKGHGCATLYTILADTGFFPREELGTFIQAGSRLGGHPEMRKAPGIEITAGSLAHGLPIADGLAYVAKNKKENFHIYCLVGDGECQEGSIWEAAMFAAQHKLNNITVIVDYNKLQISGKVDEIVSLEPFMDKWKSFGWEAVEIDGHNIQALYDALGTKGVEKPKVVIAHTIKGKGISFMEGERRWHSMLPNDEEFAIAKKELTG